MVEPVCRTCEILRNCGYVLRAVFPTEVLAAGIYSSVVFGRSTVLANAVNTTKAPSHSGPSLRAQEDVDYRHVDTAGRVHFKGRGGTKASSKVPLPVFRQKLDPAAPRLHPDNSHFRRRFPLLSGLASP